MSYGTESCGENLNHATMNIAQAVRNCGKAKLTYNRASLLSFLSINANNLFINRSTRKRIWENRIWNFNRKKLINRLTKLRQPNTIKWPSILCGNVRSIKNKLDEVKEVVLYHNCAVNVFTETWLNSLCSSSICSVQGYNQHRRDREGKSGGGIIVYTRSSVPVTVIQFENPLQLEILPLLYDFQHLLICIYHPFWQDSTMHNNAIDVIYQIVAAAQRLIKKKLHITILGDFNGLVPLMDDICHSFNLKNVVTFPTRGENTLDCCFTSKQANYLCSQVSPIGMSDHCLFKCVARAVSRPPSIEFKYVPDFSPANRALFYNEMSSLSLTNTERITDAYQLNLQFDTLIFTITSLFEHCFPLKKVKVYNNLPWINNSIRHLIRRRDNAYRRGNVVTFKHYRTKIKQEIISAKRRYCSSISTLSDRNNWKKVRSVLNIKSNTNTQSKSTTADSLLEFFTSIKNSDNASLDIDLPNDSGKCNVSISNNDVAEAILKCRKGGGIPYVSAWIIRDFAHVLLTPLKNIFQASLDFGIVPQSMKMAKITPIPKVKSPSCSSDYRPITCTSPFLKILERIVMKIWLAPLISEANFSDQYAFVPLKGRGCCSALTVLYGHCVSIFDKKQSGSLLFIDFSKAFDRASAFSVIESLIRLGASTKCIYWIYNFFQNRQVQVSFNNTVSKFNNISCGTPQGSIISPILFASLCHTLQPVTNSCKFFKYADDLTILHSFTSTEQQADLQKEVLNIVLWCKKNKMVINEKKTKLMHLARSKTVTPLPININNCEIESIQSVKILGLHLSNDLKWNLHVQQSINSASKLFYGLVSLKRANIPPKILHQIYCSLVRPILTYSSITTINMPQQLMKKLLKTEKRFRNIIGYHEAETLDIYISRLALNYRTTVQNYEEHPFRQHLISTKRLVTRSERFLVAPHSRRSLKQKTILRFFN